MPPWLSAGFQKWPVYGPTRVNSNLLIQPTNERTSIFGRLEVLGHMARVPLSDVDALDDI